MPITTPNPVTLIPPAQSSPGNVKPSAQHVLTGAGKSADATLWHSVADALHNAQRQLDSIYNLFRTALPFPDTLFLTDTTGALTGAIGDVTDPSNNESFPGIIWGKEILVGGTGPASAHPIAPLISSTQANLSTLAATLTPANTGLLVWVTDYNHVLEWNGTGWQWGPGDQGSGLFAPFAVAPTATGWHACDGSSVSYLKGDGTTGTVTLPNTVSSAAYIKAGNSYSPTINTAQAPTFTGSALPTHQHEVPIALVSNTLVVAPAPFGSAGVTAASTQIVGTSTSGNFSGMLDSAVSGGTPSGTVSIAAGDPIANFEAVLYFRQ